MCTVSQRAGRFPMSRWALLMGALLAFASAPVHAQITCSGSWLGGTGFRGLGQGHLPFPPNVRCAVAWDPDGAGSEPERLVVGGFFAIAGRTPAAMVAMWDGAHWKPLGVAGMSDEVRALAVYNGELYAAGIFATADGQTVRRMAKLAGGSWQPVVPGGTGFGSYINALVVHEGRLIAGGAFTSVEGVSANRVAAWDGTSWHALGNGVGTGVVYALASHQGSLIAGGQFTTADGVTVNGIARWDGASWSPMGDGFSGGSPFALGVHDGALYAGGYFTASGATPISCVARWDGSAWQPLGAGLNALTLSLASLNGSLYAGGMFTTAGGATASAVARWDGTGWSGVGGGVAAVQSSPMVYSLLPFQGSLFVGGNVTRAGTLDVSAVAAWNGSAWSDLGDDGPSGPVTSLGFFQGQVIAGGDFQAWEGGTGAMVSRVGRWDGAGGHALGSGLDAMARAMVGYNGGLVVGGQFSNAGGAPANRIARWDGTSWHALGTGLNMFAYALAVDGAALYAGGLFTSAGGTPANHVARWDGTSWHALGTGVDGNVTALCVYDHDLVAGGSFLNAGGSPASFVARWDGAAWHPMGSGMDGQVFALAVYQGNLYAGGLFTTADGIAANHIARWTGVSWMEVGEGLTDAVYALAEHGGLLVAAGAFEGNHVAAWNGSIWNPMGGTDRSVSALLSAGPELVAGGTFYTADGQVSAYFSRWTGDGVVWIARQPASVVGCAGGSAAMSVTPAAGYSSLSYQWRRAGTPVANEPGHIEGANEPSLRISGLSSADAGSYDCVVGGLCGSVTSGAATLGVAACCPADLDNGTATGTRDGAVTIDDLLYFLGRYEAGDAGADLDDGSGTGTRDGAVTIDDLLYFLGHYEGGC